MILSDRQIRNRWLEWEPAVIMHLRSHSSPAPAGRAEDFRQLHARRCQRIADAGIGGMGLHFWATVRRNSLDNPFWPEDKFQSELEDAMEHSRAKLGWDRKKKAAQSQA